MNKPKKTCVVETVNPKAVTGETFVKENRTIPQDTLTQKGVPSATCRLSSKQHRYMCLCVCVYPQIVSRLSSNHALCCVPRGRIVRLHDTRKGLERRGTVYYHAWNVEELLRPGAGVTLDA